VNNEYETEELSADPPAKPVIEKIRRNVLETKPRVTRFAIKWYVFIEKKCTSARLLYVARLTNFGCAHHNRDSEASAPAEFPPEQPEADLVADGDEYGAEELAEEDEEEEVEGAGPSDANGATEAAVKDDAAMDGVDGDAEAEGETGVDEDEMSEDGSVDIEGESEDELIEEEEEGEGEGEGEGGDDMEIDTDAKPAHADGANQTEVMAH
jgi:histone chaperone ASF1